MKLTLDGLERELTIKCSPNLTIKSRNQVNCILNCIGYCDDFIITGRRKELLENKVNPLGEKFLNKRGLLLSPTKTPITHIADGFDFLGNQVRKYQGKLLIKPSSKNVKAFLAKVRQIINRSLPTSGLKLITNLTPVIKGWANYHRHTVSKEAFDKK